MTKVDRTFNWEHFFKLTKEVSFNLDFHQSKEIVDKKMREIIQKSSNNKCYMCNVNEEYSSYGLQLHHIIPNGKSNENNLVYLCKHCHKIVHLILYLEGKWKYTIVSTRQPYV